MKIIIATDGSDDSVAAAARGFALLAAADAVIVARVVEAPAELGHGKESGFAGGMASDEEIAQARSAANAEAQQDIERTLAALPSGLQVQQVMPEGDPGSTLCRLAEQESADVLVIASRGRGAVKRALLGSVSTFVSNNAPCPVVIVRSGV